MEYRNAIVSFRPAGLAQAWTSFLTSGEEAGFDHFEFRGPAEARLRVAHDVAARAVAMTWTGTAEDPEDAEYIDALLQRVRLSHKAGGAVIELPPEMLAAFRRSNLFSEDDELESSYFIPDAATAIEDLTLMFDAGIISFVLGGRPRNIRACLWCGRYFEIQRETGKFDHAMCRVRFSRAQAKAAAFHCHVCDLEKPIAQASGLGLRDGDVAMTSVLSARAICLACAQSSLPTWEPYYQRAAM